ncbi:MAG: twin-arginine translocase TatA/TatE family subunit [Planctomycetaceae bacterium]|jgi:Sec-independent protein translocase protein TatA|nr:twin-arginine translocase TatA/TatE family subunit [Planctomycetaceae bacterium]
MFTFSLIELLIIFVTAIVLFGGLIIFSLRRRSEILQDILTPEEPNLATEFFKKRVELEEAAQELPQNESNNEEETIGEWGIPENENIVTNQ